MKAVIAALFLLLACASALTEKQYQDLFTAWMHQYKKTYHHDEFHVRYQNFKTNIDFINQWNANPKAHRVAMNQFGDLSLQEYSNTFLGFKMPADGKLPQAPHPVPLPRVNTAALPTSFNWNTKGAVTPIKNQGQCGSCWAFSTTGSTEGCHFLSTNNLVSLSEQNLMDCSYSQGDQSCEGGLMTDAMTYIISNGGIDTEASYPYQAADESTCNYTVANRGATLTSYVNVNSGDENDLQVKVSMGPTSVAMDAAQSSFQFYSSGVYADSGCSSTALDHGVLAIGWGIDTTTNQDYWIVKNSWGTSWGMQGFFWLARNDNNMCGIATMATLPVC